MYNYKVISFLTAAILISAISFSVSAISLQSYFTANEIKFALNGEFLTSVSLKEKGDIHSNGVENILPVRNSFLSAAPSDYDMAAVEKGFFYMDGNNLNREKIYKSLTDFPGFKGMNYYSKSEGKISTLITDSYRIQSPDDYIKYNTGDKAIPQKILSHFAIKDNRLGLLTFRNEFICDGENFIMTSTSTESVSRFGMKIFNPGDYLIFKILVYDRNLKGYFFYTVQYMKVRSSILSKIDLIKPESFGNRVRAEDIHFLKSIGIDRSGKLAAFK